MQSKIRQLSFIALCILCTQSSFAVTLSKKTLHRKAAHCPWPALPFLRPNTHHLDIDSLLQTASPEAFDTWRQCAAPLTQREAVRKLRMLRRSFLRSEWGDQLLTLSGCSRREILALFDLDASADQAREAVNCVRRALRRTDSGIRGVVRIDEDCERMKRNMIRRAENLLAAALVAVAGTGVCCAIPLSAAGWCPLFAAALIAEVTAIAELESARAFECPRCSDGPVARVGLAGSRSGYEKRFLVSAVPKTLSKQYAQAL